MMKYLSQIEIEHSKSDKEHIKNPTTSITFNDQILNSRLTMIKHKTRWNSYFSYTLTKNGPNILIDIPQSNMYELPINTLKSYQSHLSLGKSKLNP